MRSSFLQLPLEGLFPSVVSLAKGGFGERICSFESSSTLLSETKTFQQK